MYTIELKFTIAF